MVAFCYDEVYLLVSPFILFQDSARPCNFELRYLDMGGESNCNVNLRGFLTVDWENIQPPSMHGLDGKIAVSYAINILGTSSLLCLHICTCKVS